MSEHSTTPGTGPDLTGVENTVGPTSDTVRVEQAAAESERTSRGAGLMSGPFGRNLGLVVALLLI